MNQKGGFSPFIFGVLIGLSAFSVITAEMAKREMEKAALHRIKTQKEQAEDLARGLENALLTETDATYDADLTVTRARDGSSGSTGVTRSGSSVLVNVQTGENSLGLDHQRILITTTDDTMLRDDVGFIASKEDQSTYSASNKEPVAMFDSESIRKRQVEASREYLEAEAAQVYGFYAANLRFPNEGAEYNSINSMTNYVDVWGNNFTYTFIDSKTATLSFTTPWNYTYTLNLDMN